MKYECIPFFWWDSHLQEGFFEISSHRHGVKCPPTNRSKAYSAAGNQCLDIPLGILHHSKPEWRRHIQLSTLYLLHFQVRHPCEEYRTPFLRRWVGRVQLSPPLTTSGSLHGIRLCILTFPVSKQGLLVFVGSLLCQCWRESGSLFHGSRVSFNPSSLLCSCSLNSS